MLGFCTVVIVGDILQSMGNFQITVALFCGQVIKLLNEQITKEIVNLNILK